MRPLRRGAAPRRIAAALALVLLGGCVRLIPEGIHQPQTPPLPTTTATGALDAGVHPGPAVSTLGLSGDSATRALDAFAESCPRLTQRTDASQLTQPADWQPACAAAAGWPRSDAAGFFARYFETARIGDGRAFATGYYEPEIAGARTHLPGYDVPVYAPPADLVRARPGDAPPTARGVQPLGRYDADGRFVPYYERREIEAGALAGKGLDIAWVADPIEFFFLQIQGSGRLRAPDGSVMRIGFAAQNGRDYTGIGSLMRQRGLIGSGPGQISGSMQGIMQYLRDHPDDGRALLDENKSYVFFKELSGDAPLGALGVPVRGHASLAVDPAFVPLGAPVFVSLDRAEASGLWVAQDTGGAIKGANRFDTFWGAGAAARTTAGGMSARGQALILLPIGALARLPQR